MILLSQLLWGSDMARSSRKVVILSYNGLDGATAAAMALLKHPQAEVLVTSAARIGQVLASIEKRKTAPGEIHICGLGVYCDWDDVARPARSLQKGGTEIAWYCGRGYLEGQQDAFAQFCTPVFGKLSSNTEAVCEHLGLRDHANATFLLDLASQDPNIDGKRKRTSGDHAFWADLVDASIAEYFKYQDEEAYVNTIRKLSTRQHDDSDTRAVEVFRRAGFKHVLWGKSRPMCELRQMIRKCAELDEPVLISGESGVGKEYVAHLIHERSRRASGPLVPVNCAVFSGNAALANSVLFGHVKGAFTGAVNNRDGAFVTANSGILFLDEVGELSSEIQAKLLRVLEDGWATPEGSDQPRKVDVRVIAATNRHLPALIYKGGFRADLYHRLDVLLIRVPALREHLDDIPTITDQLLPTLTEGQPARSLKPGEIECLQTYDWPGNVRQLIKVLKQAIYLGWSIPNVIEEERLLGRLAPCEDEPAQTRGFLPGAAGEIRPLREVQREYAARALELNNGNYTATARMLGIATNTLRAYLK